MTNTGHTPGKDDGRGPFTAQEVNLLWHKLRVAQTRIAELEAEQDSEESGMFERFTQMRKAIEASDAKVEELQATQRPRPMDEYPTFDEAVWLLVPAMYHLGVWFYAPENEDKEFRFEDADGWLPLPDQNEKSTP